MLNARGFEGSKEDTETVIKIGQDDIETTSAVGQSGLDLGPTNSPFHPYSKVSKTPDIGLTIHSGLVSEQLTSCRLECALLASRSAFAVAVGFITVSFHGPRAKRSVCGLVL